MQTSIRVLAIEDNPDDATLLRMMLTRVRDPAFTLFHATRLTDGLQALDEQPFDIVLLDLELPDSHGFDAVRRLKENHASTPIIVLTGLDDEEIAVRTLHMDVQDYLTKGRIDANQLSRSIRYAIERKRAREALEISEARFRRLSESGIIGIVLFDLNGGITWANDQFLVMTGYSPEEIGSGAVGWDRLLPPEWKPHMLKVAEAYRITGRIAPYETEYISRNGTRHWCLFGASRTDGRNSGGIAFMVDITARKSLEQEIRHLANHDALTGLPNRRLFMELIAFELAESRRNGTRTGLLFLDLDHFKEVNDTMGHQAGDQLLQIAAERLRSAVRKSDVVARIGGDEFSLLLADLAAPDDILPVIGSIQEAFRKGCFLPGRAGSITMSMGASIYPDDSEDVGTLFRYADQALYRAKELGRNRFEFYRAPGEERAGPLPMRPGDASRPRSGSQQE